MRTANGHNRSHGFPSNSRREIFPSRVLMGPPTPPHSTPLRLGQSAASHPSLWDTAPSFCGCFFSPDQIKPKVQMRWSCDAHCWGQSSCIHEKEEGWGCNSSPHECCSKHHTKGSGSPLDGFPRIYSSAIKLCTGVTVSGVGTVVALLFICRFALAVSQPSPC